ncbi:hypothetical protein BGZ46_008373 [Entomortierella lignicola]|nr:hypothetical protein BGZ46_008373 [Entomortierella lignicola]
MAPSNTSLPSRGTRTSSRTSAAKPSSNSNSKDANEPVSTKRSHDSKANGAKTKVKADEQKKATKRQAPTGSGTRKRVKKQQVSDEDEEDEKDDKEDESEEADDDDQEDYHEQEDDEPEDEDSDADDFQDSSYTINSRNRSVNSSKKSQATKASKSSSSTAKTLIPKSKKAVNPDLLPAPTRIFTESPLKIPHPKGGPFADAIQPETLEFIRDLKHNNDREYMMLNQERCNKAKEDFLDFIKMVKEGLREADPDVMDQEPKDSMMRIYRDVRFSNDKSPYKKQFACHFSRGGKKSIAAGYYLGVSSGGETFAGCGVWDPSGPVLNRIRHGIVNHSDRFNEIMEADGIKKITGKTGIDALRPGSSRLKTGPVGFDKDHPMIEYLKRKCFAIGRSFNDKQVVSEGFLEEVLQTFDAGVELVHILNEWIG